MIRFFGIPIDTLTTILAVIASIIVGGVVLLALANAIFFKIGVRNIARRRTQMLLIIFALMLSTTLLSSVLATGDVMTAAVQTVAIYNWGSIDELIQGGQGDLGTFPDVVYYNIHNRLKTSSDIAAVGADLEETDILLTDETSRQVRSNVTTLAVLPNSESGFGGMQDVNTKKQLTIAALHTNQVYLNQTAAQYLNAKKGDTLYLYSQRWPGRRYGMQVAGIVGNNGIVGDSPTLLSQLQTFQNIEGKPDQINRVFISNRGGANGVALSDQVSDELQDWLQFRAFNFRGGGNSVQAVRRNARPGTVFRLHVIQVKQQGVQDSIQAGDIFSRIFSLFALFALAIGLLLIFLIFVLLAAERRAEMGMARAVGVLRRQLVLMFLFEGTVYDLLSSFVGLLFGIGIGALLVYYLGPILQRFNFPLKFTFQPHSLIVAYCLGVIFTFCSVALASWLVSRMTIVEAIRDQPEPGRVALSPTELATSLLSVGRQLVRSVASPGPRFRHIRRVLLEQLPDVLINVVRELTLTGFLPFVAGLWLLQRGLDMAQIIPFSMGLSLLLLGSGLLLKALCMLIIRWFVRLRGKDQEQTVRRLQKIINGAFAALTGGAIVAYWALPFDVLVSLGLPRFQGGIEVFFVAGVMMVFGTVWALVANASLFARPWLALCSWLPGFYSSAKLASAYPLQRRFRTGLSIIMFSLVVFAMTVMAIITNAMQNTYVDINTQTGGYDIQATAYFKTPPDLTGSLARNGINPSAFSVIGERDTTEAGIIQLSAKAPRWSIYPVQLISGGFLQGYGAALTAHANGFANDAAIWQALQTHSNYALIDSSALPYRPYVGTNSPVYDPTAPSSTAAGAPATPPGFDANLTFAMSGVYQGDKTFPATPVWVTGLQGQAARKFIVIGVVDNSDSAHFGLYIPRSAYSAASLGTGHDPTASQSTSYYFKVAPGQDKRALALQIGSAYLDDGMETTVLADAIWQVRGPRILLSNVLLGVVGLTLLLGVAALAITGTRAVIERRQQIGMLRAVGCSRRVVQGAFLLESFLIGALGSFLGIVLGLILASNIFATNFFEQYQTGLFFSIPWQQIAIIIGVSFLAAFLGAILPSWQAGRITPAEALRYA